MKARVFFFGRLLLPAATIIAFAGSAQATIYIKNNTTNNLTTAAGYTANSGTPTTVSDFIQFDSNYSGAAIGNTGAMAALGGFIIGNNVGANVSVGTSTGATWTVGSGSISGAQTLIDMSAANVDFNVGSSGKTFRLQGGSGSTMIFNVAGNRTLTMQSNISAQGNNKKLELQGAGNVILNGAISPGVNPFGFNVAGANVTLNAVNTFVLGTGAFTVTSGSLNIANDGALGGVTTIVANGGSINAAGAARTISQAITLGGDTNFGGAYNLSLSGNITGATKRVTYSGGQTFTLTGTDSIVGLSLSSGTGVIGTGGNVTAAAAGWSQVGVNGGDTATMTVKGTGAFTANGDFNVGDGSNAISAATGTLNIQDTATVVIGSAGGFYVGAGFVAGNLATGTINQTGGSLTANNTASGAFVIGGRNSNGGTGTYNLSAGTATLKGQAFVGGAGRGTLNISGTGIFDAQAGLKFGNNSNNQTASAGTVNLSGGTLSVGSAGISNGAGNGTLNFDGGKLKANADSATFLTGVTNAYVKAGGAVIDTNGFNVTIAQALLTDAVSTGGGLTKSSAGTLTLNGTNSYSGLTTISAGTLALGESGTINNSSGVYLDHGGTFNVAGKSEGYTVSNLTGSGSVIGALSVSNQLAIGNSPGTTNFSSSLTLGAASTYTFEVVGSTTVGGSYTANTADLGNVVGDITITSGAILNLVQLGTYTANDKFTLFSYSGALSGTFTDTTSHVLANNSTFSAGGGEWLINYNDTAGGANGGTGTSFVTVSAVPEPAAASVIGSVGLLALLRRRRQS